MIPVRGFEGRKVAVFGLARTGLAAARALRAGGAQVAVWDENPEARGAAAAGGGAERGGGGAGEVLLAVFLPFSIGAREGNSPAHRAPLSLSRLFHAAKNKNKQSNVPALNDLLAPFGVAFGDAVLEGPVGGVHQLLVLSSKNRSDAMCATLNQSAKTIRPRPFSLTSRAILSTSLE